MTRFPAAKSVVRLSLPLSYEVFAGDRADVTTMEEALATVEHKYGRARRVWVVDRGLLSEANRAAIPEHQGPLLGGHAASAAEAV